MTVRVNFGCGLKPLSGWINCDSEPRFSFVRRVDCDFPLPFNNNSVDEVLIEHLVEHLENPHDFMCEVWRICKPGASVIIEAPHSSNHVALGMLFHRSAGLSLYSFNIFNDKPKSFPVGDTIFRVEWVRFKGFDKGFFGKFLWLHEWLFNLWPGFSELFLSKWLPIWGIRFGLRAIKEFE